MTVEKETTNYSGLRTDFTLKHIFKSVEQIQRPLITVDEIRRIKTPKKQNNDPNGRIVAPGEMIIFLNGVPPIFGAQSLFFLNETFVQRTKLRPPKFRTALDLPEPLKVPDSAGPSSGFDPIQLAGESLEEALQHVNSQSH
jgi:type IV secretion system protein VirD4